MKLPILLTSHALFSIAGFALGIYTLPILIEPDGASAADIAVQARSATYKGQLTKAARGSDPLHWGEGFVYVNPRNIALDGRLAPGPDYKLYLSPEFVDTEADFERVKPRMVRVADIRAFHNFLVPLPDGVDVTRFNTVVVWCETFHQFISSARYR